GREADERGDDERSAERHGVPGHRRGRPPPDGYRAGSREAEGCRGPRGRGDEEAARGHEGRHGGRHQQEPGGLPVTDVAVVKNLGPRPDFVPNYLGPGWRRDENGNFVMPEHTLGWQVIEWAMRWLRAADGSPGWRWTPEQARFVLWWYAIDEKGRWIYSDGAIQKVKGWGKDPIAAVLGAVEIAGPCRFDYWLTPDGAQSAVYVE